MPRFRLLFGTSAGFLQPDWVLFPGSSCAAISASGAGVQLCPSAPGGDATTFGTASAAASLASGASFIIASVPGSSGRRSRAKGSSRSGGRHRRSSGCGTAHASKMRPGDRTPSPVRSSCQREVSSHSTSESSVEVRVVSPPPTAGRSLTGGTPSVSRSASAGDRSPRWPFGLASAVFRCCGPVTHGPWGCLSPLLREGSRLTTLAPFRAWTSTGMFLSGQSWPSSRTSIAWRHRQASPLLVAGLLLHRSWVFVGDFSDFSPATFPIATVTS